MVGLNHGIQNCALILCIPGFHLLLHESTAHQCLRGTVRSGLPFLSTKYTQWVLLTGSFAVQSERNFVSY